MTLAEIEAREQQLKRSAPAIREMFDLAYGDHR